MARVRRRRRVLRFAVVAAALLVAIQAIWWTQPLALFAALEWATPGVIWRVPTREKLVALTFDDGPNPVYTGQVLGLLAQHGAHATFFLIGQRAVAYPDVVAGIRAGGHEVGNHYLHRGTSLGDSTSSFEAKLLEAERFMGVQNSSKLFRPPGGVAWPWQLRRARELGYVCVLGTAYPHDPARPPVAYIKWLVAKNMVPGTIVILHDGISDPGRSIEALREILAEGRRRRTRFVTVGELLSRTAGRRTTR